MLGLLDGVTVGFVLLMFVGTAVGILLGVPEGIRVGTVVGDDTGRLVGSAPVKSIPFPWNMFPLGDIAVSMRL